jgi:argininosuccinate synthase
MLHSSSEGKVLEDPWQEAPEYVHMRTVSPMDAPDKATEVEIEFREGRSGRAQWQADEPGHACSPHSMILAATMVLAASTWSRTGSWA